MRVVSVLRILSGLFSNSIGGPQNSKDHRFQSRLARFVLTSWLWLPWRSFPRMGSLESVATAAAPSYTENIASRRRRGQLEMANRLRPLHVPETSKWRERGT